MLTQEQIELARKGELVGIFPDVDAETYHSFTNYLSATQIGAWIRSEKHYVHLLKHGIKDTASMEKGRLIHLAVGEPQNFSSHVAIGPEVTRSTNIWKAFEQQNPGKICKKPSEIEEVLTIARNVHADPQVGPLFKGALVEASFFGRCPTTGQALKCRPDLITPDFRMIADIKSTADGRSRGFQNSAQEYGYMQSAGHYLDTVEIVTGNRPENFIFIAAETSGPFVVTPYVPDLDHEFGIDALAYGTRRAREVRAEVALRLKEKAECEATGRAFAWRGYAEGFAPLTLPRWLCQQEAAINGAI